MNKLDQQKLKRLVRDYPNLNYIIFDDWRGKRFIFDCPQAQKCNSKCKNCTFYKALKKENLEKYLLKASKNDKALFGQQYFLNCKTLNQYRQCYLNFINSKCNTLKKLQNELKLVRGMKIIYAKNKNPKIVEKNFKSYIFKYMRPPIEKYCAKYSNAVK